MKTTATLEIDRDQWIPFLSGFTKDNRGAHARIEVISADLGSQVLVDGKPLEGVSADVKDRENTVWISLGSTPDDHFNHSVPGAVALRVLTSTSATGATMEIEDDAGTKTLLLLTSPSATALPPMGM